MSVVHEEGRTSGPFPDDFLTKTSVTFGQLAVREVLLSESRSVRRDPGIIVPVVVFDQVVGSNPYHRPPDFKLVIKVRTKLLVGRGCSTTVSLVMGPGFFTSEVRRIESLAGPSWRLLIFLEKVDA